MKKTISSLAKKFTACRSGIAATEFALIMPILITVFFGVVEGSSALSKSRKVSLAVNTLADLAAQEKELLKSDADTLFTGVKQIVGDASATMDIRLVSVVADDQGDPVVHWSYDNNHAAPYAKDAPYTDLPDAQLLDASSSIVVAELNYPYTSSLTHYFISNITFDKKATRWPRRSLRVSLCVSPGDCQ